MIRMLALNPTTLRELAEIVRLDERRDAQLQELRKSVEELPANELRSLEQLAARSPSIMALTNAVERYQSMAASSQPSASDAIAHAARATAG
jgi:hypothetical protein